MDELLVAVRGFVDADLPRYSMIVRRAANQVAPVFFRPRYTEFFWHCAETVPGWLPRVLIANASAEAHGSEKLWSLWERVDNNHAVEANLIRHANDESRHSRLFVRLVASAFPNALTREQCVDLVNGLPDVRNRPLTKTGRLDEAVVIDHLVQMNIGEIRTRLHMRLLGPAVCAFAPPGNRGRVEDVVYGLLIDEVRHIGYTALLLEQWAAEGRGVGMEALFEERMAEFSRITLQQTETAVRAYGQNKFPDLLEI